MFALSRRARFALAGFALARAVLPGLPPLAAQTGYLPPNPVAPPTVSPPALTPQTPLSPPSVTAPTVTGVSVGTPQGAAAGGAPAAAAPGGTAPGTASPSAQPSSASSAGAAGPSVSALSLLGLGDGSALAKALSGKGGDEASLDALSSLLGGGDSAGSLSALSAGGSARAASSDSETLRKILELLEKQQASSASGAPAVATGNRPPAASASSAAAPARSASPAAGGTGNISSGGELLRFSVNGYNVAGTVTALVSSILAKDGSFLITGDRRYPAGNRWATETFYLLCRKTGPDSYRLYADVSQDAPNPNSYLRQLAARAPFAGVLTGDLLVFRSPAVPDWNLDLVIRVHSPTVRSASGR